MSRNATITCDTCGRDLTVTGFECEPYLILSTGWRGHSGGAVFSMGVASELSAEMHFCGIHCLRSNPIMRPATAVERMLSDGP